MFPAMYNKTYAAQHGGEMPWDLYTQNDPTDDNATPIDYTTNFSDFYEYGYVITYIKAPECAQGFYNSLQSDSMSLSSMMGLIAFTLF